MKFKPIKLLYIIPVVVFASLIFIFSSESGDKSEKTSGIVVDFVISVINKDYDNMDETLKIEYRDKVSFVIRKLAHYSIFLLLSISLIIMLINLTNFSYIKSSLLTFSIASLYRWSCDGIKRFINRCIWCSHRNHYYKYNVIDNQ